MVDLATGEFSVAAPEGFPKRAVALPSNALARNRSGRLSVLVDSCGYGELLLVRPIIGAWAVSLSDGGALDQDGANDGTLVSSLDQMQAIDGTAPPPEEYAAGDILVMIDPQQLEFYAVRISP